MTLCPIAIAAGCSKCPAFRLCPLKGIIGDFKKEEAEKENAPSEKTDKADK